jgi:cytochrome d ubiquinol oxidase subunit I
MLWRKKLFDLESGLTRFFLKVAVLSIPLPFIANELGWIAAEVGRQPWAVQGMLRTSDAVSITVPASQILFSIIMFCVVYTLLGALWIFLLRQKILAGPDDGTAGSADGEEVAA